MSYRSVRRGELVPELGSVNGVPVTGFGQTAPVTAEAESGGAWSGFLDTIGKLVEAGGMVYDKYASKDTQAAQLEIAKLQAKTEAEKTAIERLKAQLMAQPVAAAGIGIGTLALLAGGGVLAYMLLARRRR